MKELFKELKAEDGLFLDNIEQCLEVRNITYIVGRYEGTRVYFKNFDEYDNLVGMKECIRLTTHKAEYFDVIYVPIQKIIDISLTNVSKEEEK